ncbi:MarR family winged helix-turn-helix transcriptional regulator [Pontivivens ytuae]|uniref:Winged helix-turn-helix transcriptional regulator n=1 Tax=Pontivivens ytuae TaxID=2789856 RepID=A0A7S9QDK7_9RHOB|nr:MarR family winged helix-turn-helix transcriptional regulator [Pontivivens ytuae]QPH54995.1 winged helix-turn-helix transcriptional regulator [Pontivivens ytuae]
MTDFDLDTFIPYRLNRAAEAVSQRFAKLYRDRYGLTRPEWRTLAALGQLGRITATQVAKHSAMHKTKVSRAVASLEERRWLSRETDSEDRRVEWLVLTRQGQASYADLSKVALDFQAGLVAKLGTDAATLNRELTAVEQAASR